MTEQLDLPLKGITVLDLSAYLSGPYGSQILGDLGAEIIKIERPSDPDHSRIMPPHFVAGDSAYYLSFNRNKKGMTLDLKQPAGLELFYELVRRGGPSGRPADVVYDNFRPGVLERLKIDYDTLREIHPGLISCSVTGYGSTGPYQDRPSYDLTAQALGGIMSFTGEENSGPVRVGVPIGDLGGGIFAAMGVLGALYQRSVTGIGRRVDVGMLDVQIALLTYRAMYYFVGGDIPKPVGSGHVSSVPIGAFRTKTADIVIDANTDRFFGKLVAAMDRPEWATDPRFSSKRARYEHKALLVELLQQVFLERPAEEWIERFIAAGVPAARINTVDRALNDPQVLARHMVVDVADLRRGPMKYTGTPIKFRGSPDTDFTPPPAFGEHTDQILRERLGLSDAAIAELRGSGVV